MDPARGLQLWPWCPVRTISRRTRAQAKIPSLECTSSLDVKSLYSPRRDRNNWNVLRVVIQGGERYLPDLTPASSAAFAWRAATVFGCPSHHSRSNSTAA